MRHRRMGDLVVGAALVCAAVVASVSLAGTGPITKQNGTTPAFQSFTSICAVPGYADYGECGGDTSKFTAVSGKVNAVQAQPNRYNFGVSFSGLVPGANYTLYQNLNGTFSAVGAGVASLDGHIDFGYQAMLYADDRIAWDLNHNGSTTIVTSYWSGQPIGPVTDQGPLVGRTLTNAFVRLTKDTVPSADGSKWDFLITNAGIGSNLTYATWNNATVPFDSGAVIVGDPATSGYVEMDEIAGTGTDGADYAVAVTCTDYTLGSSITSTTVTPTGTGYYTPGSFNRYYVYFPIQAGHSYICEYTNTHGVTAAVNDVTANTAAFACDSGATGGAATSSSVVWTTFGSQVRAEVHVVGAAANATFDVWVEQYNGTCPPGTSTPSHPAAVTTDGSGNGTATITFTPAAGATAFWMSLWTPAGSLTGTQVLRSVSVTLP